MADDPERAGGSAQHAQEETAPPQTPEATSAAAHDEEEIGDFIARHVLEKDTVFNEG